MGLQVIEGTWEEIKRHDAELAGRHVRLTITSPAPDENKRSSRPSAFGKYAFVAGGSEAFALEKQAEIEREERVRE